MSRSSQISANSFAAFCDGVNTMTPNQPYRASGSVLRTRRRTLFGAQLPSSPAGNAFADMYSADGLRMTFHSVADLRRVVGNPTDMPLDFPHDVVAYPQVVELNYPWCIGAPGQQRDIHFAFALLNQLMTAPSTSSLEPGPDDLLACSFTRLCRRNTPEYNVEYATDRALREMATIPIFRHPKVFMVPIRQDSTLSDGSIGQVWYPWQVCSNCIAVRAKGRCELWHVALRTEEPLAVFAAGPEEQSPYHVYGWFSNVRDHFMMKDLGFYDEWLCKDGVMRPIADA